MFRSYDHHQVEHILIARVTQLTTDPLFMCSRQLPCTCTYYLHEVFELKACYIISILFIHFCDNRDIVTPINVPENY
jgi:hypothetical protein